MAYVVSAQKSTAVSHCIVSHFTSKDDTNLILCKTTRLEIHVVTAEGIRPVVEVPLYGRVFRLIAFRPVGEDRDLLFIAFERFQFCVLEFDPDTTSLSTRANGELSDKIGRQVEVGSLGIINSSATLIVMYLVEGLLKILPVHNVPGSCQLKEAFNVRIEEFDILDVCFVEVNEKEKMDTATTTTSDSKDRTLAILYRDTKGGRHVTTYDVAQAEKDLIEGPFRANNIENTAAMLIPVGLPLGGLLIVGEEQITYHSGSYTKSKPIWTRTGPTPMTTSIIRTWTAIDSFRFLLTDWLGRLYILVLKQAEHSPHVELYLDYMGETHIASCMAYIDSGLAYIGGAYSDSQLIKLDQTSQPGNNVTVVESYLNLAPIVDFCVVDSDRQGQGQVVTASGAFKDGTIRIIHNGIGINELANLELTGVKGMWSLLDSDNEERMQEDEGAHKDGDGIYQHKYLVLSFLNETKLLAMTAEDEIEEAILDGFDNNNTTIHSDTLYNPDTHRPSYYLQVTSASVRIISIQDKQLVNEWTVEQHGTGSGGAGGNTNAQQSVNKINMCSCNPTSNQLVVCTSGGNLFYLKTNDGVVETVKHTQMANEISCIDITSLQKNGCSTYCTVGTWIDISVSLLELPTLKLIHKEALPGDVIARSVLSISLDSIPYLMIGMGDGNLVIYNLMNKSNDTIYNTEKNDHEDLRLELNKRITIGSQPLQLSVFKSTAATTPPNHQVQQGTEGPISSSNVEDTHVFVSSDRATVIYSQNKKLSFSNVNLKEVSCMTAFNICIDQSNVENCLALMSENTLILGTIDSIQKLHIRTIALDEAPVAITYHQPTDSFVLLTSRPAWDSTTITQEADQPEEFFYVRLFQNHTFECINTYRLDAEEHGCCCISITFNGDDTEYIVVGTAYVLPGEDESSKGRIIVFEVKGGRLNLVTEKDINGMCYCVAPFNGKLVSSCNSKIQLWKWQLGGLGEGPQLGGTDKGDHNMCLGGVDPSTVTKTLEYEAGRQGHITTLSIQTRGDYIIFGDLMRSVTVLLYKGVDGSLEEIAHDYSTRWVAAAEVIGEEEYIVADNSWNLVCLSNSDVPLISPQRNTSNTTTTADDDQKILQETAYFHLGNHVNKFRKGSLVMRSNTSAQGNRTEKDENGNEANNNNGASCNNHGEYATQIANKVDPLTVTLSPNALIFGTVEGTIGVINPISPQLYELLLLLQKALTKVIHGIGGLDFDRFRNWCTDQKQLPWKNFLDGDLIESFLDLPKRKMEEVLEVLHQQYQEKYSTPPYTIPQTSNEVIKKVEELARLH